MIPSGLSIQRTLAEELHNLANVPLRQCDLNDVKTFQSALPGYQINIVSKESFNAIVYQGPEAEKKIYLYHHDNHFDVITTMSGFLNQSYFCQKCKKGYNTKEKHICNEPCYLCHKCHEDQPKDWKYCSKCNRRFKNTKCFHLHAQISSQGNSTCQTYYRCRQCSTTVNRNISRQQHVCGDKYCETCKMFMPKDHVCYMKTTAEEEEARLLKRKQEKRAKEDDDVKKWIFFNFECTQDEMIECNEGYQPQKQIACGISNQSDCHTNPCQQGYVSKKMTVCRNCHRPSCGSYRHVPNLCVVHKVCEKCIDEDEIDWHSICKICQYKERIFKGSNTRNEFCKWLFSEENEKALIFCHNFRGYDSYPIVSYLYENAFRPEVIMNGSKFLSIEVPHMKMKFIDSMNFIPMALSKIPKAFNLSKLAKGYFPHLFNNEENQQTILDCLPDIKYYNPGGMMPEDREKFISWYYEHKNDTFDFEKEITKYCRSDVDILRRGCLKFRNIFMQMTTRNDEGIDPFAHCITIASACNLVFRKLFLEEKSIGIIPPQGYRPKDKQSVKAMQWMKYHAHQTNVEIQHAGNEGEKIIRQYKVDGYYEIGKQKVVMEFHGDYWHGNPKCYSANTLNKVQNKTMGDLYQRTLEKRRNLESLGYTYLQMWESDFNRAVESAEEMKSFIENLEMISPLEPRDAFYGGRTEAFKLHAEADENTDIKYFDVTSLYPFVNKTGKIPLGHPKIVTENFDLLQNYEGLIKCRILPPKHQYMPVLPLKINNKLLFGLCRTCMEKQIQTCKHTDRERMITGTWVTDEVKKAIEKGYVVDKIFEVWHFDRISQYDPQAKEGGAFTDYVNTFLKMKQEASGWPKWCDTEEDRYKYIEEYHQREGIRLEYQNIALNPGLRALAKLMLNSFWGKFGQRENMPKTSYVTDPSEYFDMLTSNRQQVKDVSYVSDEMVRLQWVLDDNFVETSGRTNVVIAAYTTAQARLILYSYLETLGDRTLYADTDSVIFTARPGEWSPSLGDYLGDMTDETPGKKIVSFITGGPKNYAYRAQDQDGKISTCCKVKGITLNYKNSLDINFDTIKKMITTNETSVVTVQNDYKIARDSNRTEIVTRKENKDYKLVFDKRVLQTDLTSVPYGYI